MIKLAEVSKELFESYPDELKSSQEKVMMVNF